ncbi:MAG: Zn-dependent hydrolase [Acidaminococcaceae bacterium]|nr:Zn-dependent hydrolase [Acidaminococcaceae bacterium]MBR1589591.1 Zn-dependent hydrolase [Acidaminococcaceae bacterium]
MDRKWVEMMFDEIGTMGKLDVGYSRFAYDEADWTAKQFLMKKMEEMGLTVRMDAVGNIIGRIEGTDPEAPAVAAGSHIDTVPSGGNYDGSVGVIGAMCAVQRILAKGKTKNPMEVWVFAGHESSRFGFAHLGSRCICGFTEIEKWKNLKDTTGKTVPEVLASRGLKFDEIPSCRRDAANIKSFAELHIEQGPILEDEHLNVGIVTDIAAPIRLSIKVKGNAAHSGTTPMAKRHDALVAAAEIVLAVRKAAVAKADKGIVGTVGYMTVKPGAMNIVPGDVVLWVDVRGNDFGLVSEVIETIKQDAKAAADKEGVELQIDTISSSHPVHLSDELIRLSEESCKEQNIPYTFMIGGGGHDSQEIGQIIPTVVLHIPCRNGVSHTPEEFASIDDIMVGIDALTGLLEKQVR